MADYFSGKWGNNRKKPLRLDIWKGKEEMCDRKVTNQVVLFFLYFNRYIFLFDFDKMMLLNIEYLCVKP